MRGNPQKVIAVITDWYWPELVGGAERALRDLARELDAKGFRVLVLTPGSQHQNYNDGGVEVRVVPMAPLRRQYNASRRVRGIEFLRYWADPLPRRRFKKAIKNLRCHAVIVSNTKRFWPTLWRTLRRGLLGNPPILVLHHDFTSICVRRSRYRREQACKRTCASCAPQMLAAKACAPFVDVHITNSYFAAEVLDSVLGIQSCVAYPITKDQLEVRSRQGRQHVSPNNQLTVGFLGRIAKVKGVDLLLDAAAHLRDQFELTVCIAGDAEGAYAEGLLATSQQGGIPVRWLGNVPPTQFAAEIDVAVVPSRWPEPFGRAAIEMATLGTPTVVTPAGGLREIAGLLPEAVFISPSASPRDLARTIVKAAGSPGWASRTLTAPLLSEEVLSALGSAVADEPL